MGQAILMGCGRKYVSWLNGAPRVPIGSLRYFEPILEEVQAQPAPAEYWDYLRFRLERMEKTWLEANGADACARPNAPAGKALKGEMPDHGLASDR